MKESDWDVVQEILNGKGELFGILVNRYKNAIYSLCYRMVNNREEAEDLAQEVFIRVYNSLKKYDPKYKFSTWILRVATNICIDFLRKKKVESIPLDDGIANKEQGASAEDIFFHKSNKEIIEKAIHQLPEEYRILILLYHNNGLSYKEIAENMKLPMSKVKNRLFRARNLLKEQLKDIREEESQWIAKQVQI